MTLHHDFDRLIRALGLTIWLLMLLALCAELGAIIGWLLGDARRGAWIGMLAVGVIWLWAQFGAGNDRKP